MRRLRLLSIHAQMLFSLRKGNGIKGTDMCRRYLLDEGVHQWRRESGYYQQSKVENGFYRYKTIIGRKLRARTEESREVETILGCKILNRFLELGRCDSKFVA